MADFLKFLAVRVQNGQVFNFAEPSVPIPSSQQFGRHGRLDFDASGDCPVFTYYNRVGAVVYSLSLDRDGEYFLDTTKGERTVTEDEKHREVVKAERRKRDDNSRRNTENAWIQAGVAHYKSLIFNTSANPVLNHGETYETKLPAQYDWCRTDGEVMSTPCGDGEVVVVVTGATWAVFSSWHIVVWRSQDRHIYTTDEMYTAIGEALQLESEPEG